MAKKTVIIGAGIAGLCAGAYLRMNGYDTEIVEMHTVPGGLCTAWKRSGYTFDGCIHWLVGSSPGDPFYRLWNEIIEMRKLAFVDFDEYLRVEDGKGGFLRLSNDADRLEHELLSAAPEDAALIRDFVGAVRKAMSFRMPVDKAQETFSPLDGIKMTFRMLPFLSTFRKYGPLSGRELADQCRNPLLKKAVERMFVPEMSALFLVMTMAWMCKKSAGYPLGGSLPFARLVEDRYLSLGGKIRYRSRVRRILVENGRARGVELENGERIPSDAVISAADGYGTIFEMLEGKFTDSAVRKYFSDFDVFPSYLQVSAGVKRAFDGVPHHLVFPVGNPLWIDDRTQVSDLAVRFFNFDPSLAPKGGSVFTAQIGTANHAYWTNLREKHMEKYLSEKRRIGEAVVEAVDRRIGNVKASLEVLDVSTPATVIRYTGNWKGSFEGWIMNKKSGFRGLKKTLPGLKGFYMAGQWVEPGGGLPACILSGRNVAQILCKEDGKKFVTQSF